MDSARESRLIRAIPSLASIAEADGFRVQLDAQGELHGTVNAILDLRVADLKRREGRG